MVKVLALIPQREDISRQQFHSHWLSPHGEMACGIDTLQRYVQCHRIRPGLSGLPEADYEGIAEVWFVDVATAAAMAEHPVYVEKVNPDEPNFIDVDRLAFVFTDETVIRDGGPSAVDDPAVKAQILLRKPAASSREEFATTLAELDEATAEAFPTATRIVRSQAREESYAEGDPAADAFIELWWTDRAGCEAEWEPAADEWLANLSPAADLDATTAFLSEETRLIWP